MADFPLLSWLAVNPIEAFSRLANLVREVIEDMVAGDEPVPEPLSERTYVRPRRATTPETPIM